MNKIIKKLVYGICNFTRLTNFVTRFTGTGFFLPKLFRLRYANFGNIDPDLLGRQMRQCISFEENTWCTYWNNFAKEYAEKAKLNLQRGEIEEAIAAGQKSIAYYSISAFPGNSPRRIIAHTKARVIFEDLLPFLSENLEKITLEAAGERLIGYLFLPDRVNRHPIVLVTNGLEGTSPELAIPLRQFMGGEIGVFIMEMPGTYQYEKPLTVDSRAVYEEIIDYLAEHKNIDENRIAMVGVSFGAHWSARMAALDPRIKCAVANGAPLTFGPDGNAHSDIFIAALKKVTGSRNLFQLIKNLKQLSFKNNSGELYQRIKVPLLVINGSMDTLIPVQDSIDLSEKVPSATLKLYDGDDHCAMEHYMEMIEYCFSWIEKQLNVHKNKSGL